MEDLLLPRTVRSPHGGLAEGEAIVRWAVTRMETIISK